MGVTRLRLGKPVIAAVEGPAIAGGLEVACWADLRVAGEGAISTSGCGPGDAARGVWVESGWAVSLSGGETASSDVELSAVPFCRRAPK